MWSSSVQVWSIPSSMWSSRGQLWPPTQANPGRSRGPTLARTRRNVTGLKHTLGKRRPRVDQTWGPSPGKLDVRPQNSHERRSLTVTDPHNASVRVARPKSSLRASLLMTPRAGLQPFAVRETSSNQSPSPQAPGGTSFRSTRALCCAAARGLASGLALMGGNAEQPCKMLTHDTLSARCA